jgi:hypothetical protein
MKRQHNCGDLLALVKSLASRPDGLSRAELAERINMTSNAPILTNAKNRGHIVSAKRPGEPMRYFITAQNAAEWLAREPAPKAEKALKVKPAKVLEAKPKAAAVRQKMGAKVPHRPKPKPHQTLTINAGKAGISGRLAGEAILTAKTVFTLDTAERPVAKWQVLKLSADPRWPSFSSAPAGVNPDTGRAWGARA